MMVGDELRDWLRRAREGDPSAYDGPEIEDVSEVIDALDEFIEAARNTVSWYAYEGRLLEKPLAKFGDFSREERIGVYEDT